MEQKTDSSKTIPAAYILLAFMVIYDFTQVLSALAAFASLHILGMLRGLNYVMPILLFVLLFMNKDHRNDKLIAKCCIANGIAYLLFHVLLNVPDLINNSYTQKQLITVLCVIGLYVMAGLSWIICGILITKGKGIDVKSFGYKVITAPVWILAMAALYLPLADSAFKVPGSIDEVDMMSIYNIIVPLILSMAVTNPERSHTFPKKVVYAVCAVLLVVFIGVNTIMAPSGSNSSHTNTCASCGRKYSAGDTDKNYMSIASSGMCNNCKGNFLDLRQFLGD